MEVKLVARAVSHSLFLSKCSQIIQMCVCVCFESDLQAFLQVSVSKYCAASLLFADLASRSISETSVTDYRQDSLEIFPKRSALENEGVSYLRYYLLK